MPPLRDHALSGDEPRLYQEFAASHSRRASSPPWTLCDCSLDLVRSELAFGSLLRHRALYVAARTPSSAASDQMRQSWHVKMQIDRQSRDIRDLANEPRASGYEE
jgi:hypothetical protein